MAAGSEKVPVTQRALVLRISRKLATLDPPELLRTNRARRGDFGARGLFFTVDTVRHSIARFDVDLLALARELGVLAPWEDLAG